jgi:hypothetical protein
VAVDYSISTETVRDPEPLAENSSLNALEVDLLESEQMAEATSRERSSDNIDAAVDASGAEPRAPTIKVEDAESGLAAAASAAANEKQEDDDEDEDEAMRSTFAAAQETAGAVGVRLPSPGIKAAPSPPTAMNAEEKMATTEAPLIAEVVQPSEIDIAIEVSIVFQHHGSRPSN